MRHLSFEVYTRKLLRDNADNIIDELEREAKRLALSGGIDLASYNDDDYEAPKIALHVALLNIADRWLPLSSEGKAVAENLKHF